MATFNKVNKYTQHMNRGDFVYGTSVVKVALFNTAPVATNDLYSDLSGEVANGNGYTTGGETVTGTTSSTSSGTESAGAAATTWTSSTGNMGPFRYVAYYITQGANKYIIGWYDYGSSITLNGAAGESFVVTPAGAVLYTVA